jgi:hypothetical protein
MSGKDELVKARVSRGMKSAVVNAAAAKGDREAEAVILREALAEYFAARGIRVAEDEPEYQIAAKRKQSGDPLAKAGQQMAKIARAKKRAAKHQKKSAA